MKRLVVVLLVVVLVATAAGVTVAALLGAFGSRDTDPDDPGTALPTGPLPPQAGSTRAPEADLRRFYQQEVSWEPCRDDEFLCTHVEVPLDYAEPSGRTIELALLMAPATDRRARLGSLVVNPGGPGAPGTDYAASAATTFRTPLTEHYDIVGFDPRGTGSSAPVDCLSDADLDAYLASDPTPDDAAERAEAAHWVRRLGAGCVRLSGTLAGHVSTIEAARDMDVIRAVLGQRRLTYLGASYGTQLGATYAELYPKRVGRFVLDGAVDVSMSARARSLGQARGFETALRAYVAYCLDATDSCVLGDTVEEGLARIRQLLDEVDASPLPTADGRELRVGNAFLGLILPLYNEQAWSVLSLALGRAFDGDGTTLMALSDIYASREDDGSYADNRAEAIYAISCLDDPSAIAQDQVADQLPAFERASPTLGEVFAWGLTGCSGIQVRSSQPPLDIRAEGAPPIVVVGTTRDPATPYRWAKALAAQLDSGVLVSRDGDGHTGYNMGNGCVDSAVESYFVEGIVPRDGLRC